MVSDTTSRGLTVYQAAPPAVVPLEETERIASIFAASGFFADTKAAAQCVVKIMAGRELGFGPFASMQGIHVIQGKVALSANLIAAAIKRSGKYNYRVLEMTASAVEIAYYEWGEEIGKSRFTEDDAGKASTKNMQAYPRNMLFARAMSNGAKWYCSDIFAGGVYTPDELGPTLEPEAEPIPVVKQLPERPAALIKALADWHEEATRARANGIEPAERDIDAASYEELRESSTRLLKLRQAAEKAGWPALIGEALELGLAADFIPEIGPPSRLKDAVEGLKVAVARAQKARAEAGEEGPAPEALKVPGTLADVLEDDFTEETI